MCLVVFYELRRGLAHRDARRQLGELDTFARTLRNSGLTAGVRVGLTTTPTS